MSLEPSDAHFIFAALAALEIDPTANHLGWRLWGSATHDIGFVHRGDQIACQLCLHPSGAISLLREGNTVLTLTDLCVDGARMAARTGASNAHICATVRLAQRDIGLLISVLKDGTAQEFLLPDLRLGNSALIDTSDSVVAPMTGMIVNLDIVEGARVKKGALLGVMEAMKMETALIAPRDGLVSEVLCATGDAVEGGTVLIIFEAEPAE